MEKEAILFTHVAAALRMAAPRAWRGAGRGRGTWARATRAGTEGAGRPPPPSVSWVTGVAGGGGGGRLHGMVSLYRVVSSLCGRAGAARHTGPGSAPHWPVSPAEPGAGPRLPATATQPHTAREVSQCPEKAPTRAFSL